jgi:ParB family chromosome partitioning protein
MTAGSLDGCVNLEWAIDAITVGVRHRHDLGDLQDLTESIEQHGLLQPVTVTPDGTLICGARRLAALKRLGHRRVPVWVRSGLSDRLSSLMAERDENTARKQYTKTELASLYEELKQHLAAEAERRQRATRFGAETQDPSSDGSADFAEPWRGKTDSRRQAAAMVGGASHSTLEKILTIRRLAEDPSRPDALRREAGEAFERIGVGAAVDPLFNRLRALVCVDDLDQIAATPARSPAARADAAKNAGSLRQLADDPAAPAAELGSAPRAALVHVRHARQQHVQPTGGPSVPASVGRPPGNRDSAFKSVKSFIWTWTEMADWPSEYDPSQVAEALSETQYDRFLRTMEEANQFTAELARRREQRSATGAT